MIHINPQYHKPREKIINYLKNVPLIMHEFIISFLIFFIYHGLVTVPIICSSDLFGDPQYYRCKAQEQIFMINDHHLILHNHSYPLFSLNPGKVYTYYFTDDANDMNVIFDARFYLHNKTNDKTIKMSIFNENFQGIKIPYNCYSKLCLEITDLSIIGMIYSMILLAIYAGFFTLIDFL